jgi:TonB family protein
MSRVLWGAAALAAALALSQGCASAPRGAPELLTSCDALFRSAPAALPVDPDDAPQLLNGGAVGAAVASGYPTRLSRVAVVQALVQPDGRISHACVFARSGDAEYDHSALAAARVARWNPALRDGAAVEAWVSFPISTRAAVARDPSGRYVPLALEGGLAPGRLTRDDVAIQATVLRHLLAERDEPPIALGNRALCVGVGPGLPLLDPPKALTRSLAGSPIPVVPATACRIDLEHAFPGMRGARLLLARTGEEAAALWTDLPEHTRADAVRVRAGYYADGPAASGYECTLHAGDGAWRVVRCSELGSD